MKVTPRHPECVSCRFFNKTRENPRCKGCGSGEFFEEKTVVREPSDAELMRIYQEMHKNAGFDYE